ncbi:hypothetical protein RND81_03G035300 [Saponaria officinalis]|uniref:Ubiquitin-like protease family profile domain-containing protein n=1 Tax=Saponaria officinalis TaxID=3572 RepID=A0AAW1M484_SAPOF
MERMLCSTLSQNSTHLFSMEINESVYIYKNPITLYLTKSDIRQMFRYKWLNISMLQLWGSFLHDVGTSLGVSKVVGYLCPERLSSYVHDPVEMKKYVSHALKIQENKKYVMGAFFEMNHWMLVVFCPKDDIAYIFESDQKTKKTLAIKDHLPVIWKLFDVVCGRRLPSKKNILEIKMINCPQQPHDFECGYYVMKWMYDITAYYSMIEDNLEKSVSGSTMMVEDMDQVRVLLAKYCMEHL